MKIEVHNSCTDFDSYRAARVKSLFNVDTGANFDLVADLPVDDKEWRIGLVVGPSGSGKTSIGKRFFGNDKIYEPDDWPHDKPIIDAIAPEDDFDKVTGALSAVGLGTVPTWLRPYPDGETSGDVELTGDAIVTGVSRSIPFDGIVTISFTFQGNGALTVGTVSA